MRICRLLLIGLFLCAGLPGYAAVGSQFVAAVEAALAHNPGLKAGEAQIRQAEAGLQEANFQRLPMLSARSQYTRSDQPVFVFGSLMNQGRFTAANFAIDSLNNPGDLTNIQSALDLGLPLFTGFQLTSAVRLGELGASQAQSGREQAAQQIRLQAALLYERLIHYRELIRSLDERITASEQEVADARKLKERGLVFGSDYYAAEAIYGGLKGWRIQAQSEQAATLSRLAILTGKADWQPLETLPGSTPPVPPEAELQKAALLKRPELRAADAQVRMASINRQQAGRTVLPKVQAFASLETNTEDFNYNPTNHAFGVTAQFPFGDPAYFARRARTTAAEEAAKDSQINLEDVIRSEVSQAYEAYQGALAALPVARDTRDRAAKSLELFRPLYRSGRQSILDVLRAEEALAKAASAYLETVFNLHSAYLQLQTATGSLDDKTIEELGRQMKTPS